MAFRSLRGSSKDKPEPLRKRRKLNQMFDEAEVAQMSRNAEISADQSMTLDEKRIAMGKRILAAAKEDINYSDEEQRGNQSNHVDQRVKWEKNKVVHKNLMTQIHQLEGRYRFRLNKKLKTYIAEHQSLDAKIKTIRGHRLSVTCMAVDPTGQDRYVFTGSKDGSIIKWDLRTGRRVRKIWHAWPIHSRNKKSKKTGHKLKWGGLRKNVWKKVRPKPVLALAISPDEKWLVSGGEDHLIRVWNAKTMLFKSTFKGGHRSKITGLAFSREDNKVRRDDEGFSGNTLFSTGTDRQIRVYDMNEMGFAEPLYGHTGSINTIAATNEDRVVTVSEDKTIRYWKLRTQSQLIFTGGHDDSIDAVCILTPGRFVTGSQDGSIALWSTAKKKPLQKETNVHLSRDPMDRQGKGTLKHWIVSLSAKHNCDVFASGSSDGVVKLWSVKSNSFYHLRSIRIPKGAFVNCMQWAASGKLLICGLGTEHRLGRWEHVNGARNGIAIIKLPVGWEEEEESNGLRNEDEKEDETNGDIDMTLTSNGHSDKHSDKQSDKQSDKNNEIPDIVYDDAEDWDKWDPREKGHPAKDTEMTDKDDSKEKEPESDEEREWKSFFGNVFT